MAEKHVNMCTMHSDSESDTSQFSSVSELGPDLYDSASSLSGDDVTENESQVLRPYRFEPAAQANDEEHEHDRVEVQVPHNDVLRAGNIDWYVFPEMIAV